ncbi:hypothetical protein A6A08_22735 [Nocardiopsis sp. TSRI0078]|uniref:hypothetical protein n=1 Tax=unclassified Nocardiopsis TaxID=2649073 RepID=UPI00093DFFE4|nr:hypothetical protein [Nocardiopsis sp. TSRI0078]OKI20384.1 hypothetical protein A6A08_22735 [Nocardiopsis sp. TSRI0078]
MPKPLSSAVLSASVMTHPRRSRHARRVLDSLGIADAALAPDPEPEGPPSSLRASQAAFSDAARFDSTHHLVLQDDVRVCADFPESVRGIVERHPGAAVSLFVEWGSRTAYLARWAVLAGSGAVPVINPYMPTPALLLPRDLAVDMGRFMKDAGGRSDDRAALRFLRERGVPALTAVPNLVEHEDLPSLKGNDGHGIRRSVCFAAEGARFDGTVLDVPPLLPFLRWNTCEAVVIDTAHDVPGAHRPTLEVLGEWGAGPGELRRACADRLGTGSGPLFALWLTAVALGAVQERHWPGTVARLRERSDQPLVRRALASLAPGALRVFLDPDRLAERSAHLVPALITAMEHGSGLTASRPA